MNIEIPEGASKNIDAGIRMPLGKVMRMNWKLVKRIMLLCVGFHTLYVLFVFGFVHFHKTAQDAMYWFMFFPGADDPLVTLGFTIDRELFHFTAPLTALWYNLGFSGLNMRSGLIYLLFGGTQWAVWGFALGCAIVGIKEKLTKRHELVQQPTGSSNGCQPFSFRERIGGAGVSSFTAAVDHRSAEGNAMPHNKLLMVAALILLGAGCGTLLEPKSARRYVEVPESDLTTSKFYLLDRREVQRELALTASQVKALAAAFNTPFERIPGLGEWRRSFQALSQEEKRRQKSQYLEGRQIVTAKWLESQLADILREKQKNRLDALLLQMKGSRAIVGVPGVTERLGLTPTQTLEIQSIIRECHDDLSPLYQRYGHNMLQTSRRSQTMEESEKEQDAVVVIITEILKSQDESILAVLTKAQCDQWHAMQGPLLRVSWPETAGFYVPFQSLEKASNRVGGRVSAPASHTPAHAGPRTAVPGSPGGRSSTLALPR